MVERILVGNGPHDHFLSTDGEFREDIGLAHQELVDVVHVLEGDAVDGGDDIAFLHAEARLLERGTQLRPVGRTLEDAVDAEAVLDLGEFGAQQAHRDALRLGIVGRRGDIGVAAGHLGDHLTDDVVHVQAGLGVRDKHFILGLDGLPVASVHVLQVVAVAEGAPDLVIELGPFLGVVHRGDETVQGHFVLQAHLGGGSGHIHVTSFDEDSLLVPVADHHPGVGALFVLLGGKVEDPGAAAAAVPELAAVAVETASLDGQLDDAVDDPVGVDGRGRLFSRFRGARFLRIGLGLVCRGLFHLYDRILRDQRGRRILGQHGHIHAGHVAVGVVPFDAAVLRIEVAVGGEDEVLAVGAEGGAAAVVPALGDGVFLPAGEVVQIDDAHLVGRGLGIGKPLAVRRILDAVELGLGVLHHGALGFGERVHLHDAVLAVGVEEVLAVRAPLQGSDVGVGPLRDLDGRAAVHGVIQVDLRLARGVADPGDPFTVRAPVGAAVVGTGRAADAAGDALFHGDVEDFAAGGHDHPGPVGREAHGSTLPGDVDPLGASVNIVRCERYGNLDGLAVLRVQPVQPAAVLEDDGLAVGGGELHVVLLEVRHLLRLLRLGIVHEQVHDHVAVGGEEDLVADPHREDVLGYVIGDILHLAGLGVIDPHVVRHATPVVLPGAEFAHHAVVGQFLPVRGIGAEAALRERNLRRHAPFRTHGPEFSREAVADAVAIDDLLPVRGPAHHDVVRAHAVAQVVAAVGGRVGQSDGFAALGRNQIHFPVAVVFGGEGDALAVRRVPGEHFIADVGGQAPGFAARHRHGPQVAGVGKRHFAAAYGRKAQQAGLVGMGGGRREGHRRQGQEDSFHIVCLDDLYKLTKKTVPEQAGTVFHSHGLSITRPCRRNRGR